MRTLNQLAFAVTISLSEYSLRPVFLMYSLDLAGDDISGLIPGDPLIFAYSTVLRVPLALGVPIHPLEGIEYAVGRVNSFFISQGKRAG